MLLPAGELPLAFHGSAQISIHEQKGFSFRAVVLGIPRFALGLAMGFCVFGSLNLLSVLEQNENSQKMPKGRVFLPGGGCSKAGEGLVGKKGSWGWLSWKRRKGEKKERG